MRTSLSAFINSEIQYNYSASYGIRNCKLQNKKLHKGVDIFLLQRVSASKCLHFTYMELAMLTTFLDNVQAYIVVTPGVTTWWFSYDGEEDTPRELYCNKNLSDMIQNWHTNAIYLDGILSTAWLPIATLHITICVFQQYVCTVEIHTYTAGTILQTRKDDHFINHNHAKIFIVLYTIWSIIYTYIHLHVNDVVSWILTDTSFIFLYW